MKRLVGYGIALGILALFVIGALSLHNHKAPKASGLTLADMQAQLRGSPPQLAALHADGAQLLPTSRARSRTASPR